MNIEKFEVLDFMVADDGREVLIRVASPQPVGIVSLVFPESVSRNDMSGLVRTLGKMKLTEITITS
jgi:hypothetical protein